jgi:aspartate carbamoyltransferase catalytic subunit
MALQPRLAAPGRAAAPLAASRAPHAAPPAAPRRAATAPGPAAAAAAARGAWLGDPLKHVVESQQFDAAALERVFAVAREMEAVRPNTDAARVLSGAIMSTLFYEPSTRTRLSFESAMARLGGTVLSTESAGEYSSAAKGETLEGASRCASAALAQPHCTSCAFKRRCSSRPSAHLNSPPPRRPLANPQTRSARSRATRT